MAQSPSCCAIALACCMAASGGAVQAWTGSAVLGGAGAAESCDPASSPCLQLWSEMTAQKRAELWPYLDDVSRNSYWRSMSPEERRALRSCMSERDREAMRRRFSVDTRGANGQVKRPKLCREDMRLMREQIMEVHMHHLGRGSDRAGAKDLAAPGTIDAP